MQSDFMIAEDVAESMTGALVSAALNGRHCILMVKLLRHHATEQS